MKIQISALNLLLVLFVSLAVAVFGLPIYGELSKRQALKEKEFKKASTKDLKCLLMTNLSDHPDDWEIADIEVPITRNGTFMFFENKNKDIQIKILEVLPDLFSSGVYTKASIYLDDELVCEFEDDFAKSLSSKLSDVIEYNYKNSKKEADQENVKEKDKKINKLKYVLFEDSNCR